MVKLPESFSLDNTPEFDRNYISPQWFSFEPQNDTIIDNKHYSDPIPDYSKFSSTILQYLRSDGWIEEDGASKEITYVTYKHGYRTPIVNKESAIFLGCSHTFGTGLNLEQTFSFKISKLLNLTNINLGCPGASLDYCYRALKNFQLEVNPKYIFCLVPDDSRVELFFDKSFVDFPHSSNNHNTVRNIIFNSINSSTSSKAKDFLGYKEYISFLKYYAQFVQSTPEVRISNFNRNIDAINNIANDLGSTFIYIPMNKYLSTNFKDSYKAFGIARDGAHFGEKFHDIITEDFLKQI